MYKAELVKKLEELWEPGQYADFEVEIKSYNKLAGELSLRISKMYSYVEVSYEILQRVSEFMQTTNINLGDKDFSNGCQSCDYGSNYWVDIHFKNFWIPIEGDLKENT